MHMRVLCVYMHSACMNVFVYLQLSLLEGVEFLSSSHL